MQRGSENRLLQNGPDKFMKGAMTQLPATAGDHTYWSNKALCRPSQAPSFQVKRTLCYSAGNQMPVMSALPRIHRDKHDVHEYSTFPKPPCCKADCGLSKPTFLCQTYCGLYFRLFSFLFYSLSKTGTFKRTGKATESVFKLQWRLVEGEWYSAIPAGLWKSFRMKQVSYRKHVICY